MTVQALIAALFDDDWPQTRRCIDAVESMGQWADFFSAVVLKASRPPIEAAKEFQTYWVERGFRVRAAVGNDDLTLDALRLLLPPYGGAGLMLYRGENLDRWRSQEIGFGWSSKKAVAEVFARGLAASEGTGGALICADVPAEAIIAGPNEHSAYLGEDEYIVDVRMLRGIELLRKYPRVY